ncbi:MAG: ABC transporter permease [Planctomycetes bacterium]|nr:ABC transporter permease [Planctomycetota bacterium]
MNSNVTRALFRDAFAQVVDNRVFRILFVILCVLVLPTFLIGARPEHLTVLFVWDYEYDRVFGFFGQMAGNVEHPDRALIQATQKLLTDVFAGSFGILFGIAATAFFVPRMLEKGAADVVFSKPVSRFALLLTRYFAGLVFAAVLATVMIGGMHLGFLLVSGWSDPGFLWSIPILIYVFAVVHAVSCLVGVFTRSSVAAMLVTLVFYAFNGCVQNAWQATEATRNDPETLAEETEEIREEAGGAFLETLFVTLDVAHYVLPKTTEADFIARSTRQKLERRGFEFWDQETGFYIAEPPDGFVREAGSSIEGSGLAWSDEAQPNAARITLSRVLQADAGSRLGASKKFFEELQKDSRVTEAEREKDNPGTLRSYIVRWMRADEGTGGRKHYKRFFENGKWLYTLESFADVQWLANDENERRMTRFRWQLNTDESDSGAVNIEFGSSAGTALGLHKRYGWDAPLKYNYFFSIGSTLGFIVVVLALAQWKLRRMDF